MKIVFENPETRNRDSVILDNVLTDDADGFSSSEFRTWKMVYDSAKATEMIFIKGYGELPRNSIKGIVEIKEKRKESAGQSRATRFEICSARGFSDEEKKEWSELVSGAGIIYGKIPTEFLFLAVVKSLFNSGKGDVYEYIRGVGVDELKKKLDKKFQVV